jgi:hypothetical protein
MPRIGSHSDKSMYEPPADGQEYPCLLLTNSSQERSVEEQRRPWRLLEIAILSGAFALWSLLDDLFRGRGKRRQT